MSSVESGRCGAEDLTSLFSDTQEGFMDQARIELNQEHLRVFEGLTARFPGNKISDFAYQLKDLGGLYLIEGLQCTELNRFRITGGETVEFTGFESKDWNVWDQDIGILQYLFGLYYTSVCATGRRKLKYAVRDRKYIIGWDAVTAIPYKVSVTWLDLAMVCCYHHVGFREYLDFKRYFYWVEEQTGLVLYRKKFL